MKILVNPLEKYLNGEPLTIKEAADLLGISQSSINRMVEKGEIQRTKVGSLQRYVFKASEIKRLRLEWGYEN